MSASEWEERLSAQGISAERIADAKRAARLMTDAFTSIAFTPDDPIAPEDINLTLESGKSKKS